MMIWAAISCSSAGLIITLNGRITASVYVYILDKQVHPRVQMFPKMLQSFKITNRSNTQPQVFSRGLRSLKIHFSIFPCQHNRQT